MLAVSVCHSEFSGRAGVVLRDFNGNAPHQRQRTVSKIQFSEIILITGSQTTIFDYTQDYENRLTWDTFLTKGKLT